MLFSWLEYSSDISHLWISAHWTQYNADVIIMVFLGLEVNWACASSIKQAYNIVSFDAIQQSMSTCFITYAIVVYVRAELPWYNVTNLETRLTFYQSGQCNVPSVWCEISKSIFFCTLWHIIVELCNLMLSHGERLRKPSVSSSPVLSGCTSNTDSLHDADRALLWKCCYRLAILDF